MSSFRLYVIFLVCLFFQALSFGQSIYVGAELNFTNEKSKLDRSELYNFDKFNNGLIKKEILKICKDCELHKVDGWPQVTYPDGWWFKPTVDTGVVEIKTLKTTANEYRQKYKNHLDDIFLLMRKFNFKPDPQGGLSHMHIDYETAFHSNIIHFRNYLVHLINHQGTLELLGAHDANGKFNAVFLSEMYKKETIEPFIDYLNKLDEKILFGHKLPSISEFIDLLPEEMRRKFVAINLQHSETMEIRSLSSPKNSDQFIDTAAFLTGAIEYVKKVGGLIPLEEIRHPNLWTEQEKIDSFHQFSVTQGKDSEDFKHRVLKPEQWYLTPSENQKEIKPIIRSCPLLFL